MTQYVQVPNVFFDFEKIGKEITRQYTLRPIDLRIYLYLLSINFTGSVIARLTTIANRCFISTKGVQSSLKRLEVYGLIKKEKRANKKGLNTTNKYHINTASGAYTKLDVKFLKLDLSPATLMILIYLHRCANTHGFCCPSISKIAYATGLSQVTVNTVISLLCKMHLIKKTNQKSILGDFSNNNYMVRSYTEYRRLFLRVIKKSKPHSQAVNSAFKRGIKLNLRYITLSCNVSIPVKLFSPIHIISEIAHHNTC